MKVPENIHTQDHRFLKKDQKEKLLGTRGKVIWLYGLSGSGKSTIAAAVEKLLAERGRFSLILDGDNLRAGLNADLGFSDEDRYENVRRVAEISRVLSNEGMIVLVAVITPLRSLRSLARQIVGPAFCETFVQTSLESCALRDPKGLYAKAGKGQIEQFTGFGSDFEEPDRPDLLIDTDQSGVEDAAELILNHLQLITK